VLAKKSKKKKKKPKAADTESSDASQSEGPAVEELSADSVTAERERVQESAKSAGDPKSAAETLEQGAKQNGDPVLFLDAAQNYIAAGKADRDEGLVELGIENARIALDVLHFVRSPAADPSWQVVASNEVKDLIERGNDLVREGQRSLDSLESSGDETEGTTDEEPKRKRKRRKGESRPGAGAIAGGSVLLLAGVAGVAMIGAGAAISRNRQDEVEALELGPQDEKFKELDAQGKRANMIAYIGIPLAAVGLIGGITLLALGAKRAKAGKSTSAHAWVMPTFGGLVVSGKF